MLKINKIQYIIISIILIIAVCIIYYFYTNSEEESLNFLEENIIEEKTENIVEVEKKQEIVIHITGQVQKSGIVRLKENARIIDAIEAAGGVTQKADLEKVNLAYVLSDGQKVYIPSVDEKDVDSYVSGENGEGIIVATNEESKLKIVNINSATVEELQGLPGIGESIAQKIVAYRNSNGKFSQIEDIKNVSGIGEAKFNNIKEYISVK